MYEVFIGLAVVVLALMLVLVITIKSHLRSKRLDQVVVSKAFYDSTIDLYQALTNSSSIGEMKVKQIEALMTLEQEIKKREGEQATVLVESFE